MDKYVGLVSLPLFGLIAYILIRTAPEFSYSKLTISKFLRVLQRRRYRLLFRLNFILKSLVDCVFLWYLVHHLALSWASPVTLLMMTTVILFASLAYFTEESFFCYSQGYYLFGWDHMGTL